MRDRVLFDTNILVYYLSEDPKTERAESLLIAGGYTSVHVLNEFVAVVRRKLGFTWQETADALAAIRIFSSGVVPTTIKTHERALAIATRYGYRIYDSLVLAAALDARCNILYTEDMQQGQLIEGKLTIRNPFT